MSLFAVKESAHYAVYENNKKGIESMTWPSTKRMSRERE